MTKIVLMFNSLIGLTCLILIEFNKKTEIKRDAGTGRRSFAFFFLPLRCAIIFMVMNNYMERGGEAM